MIVSSQLRAGGAIRHEGKVYKVLAADYHPGQGKMGGVSHTRLQNIETGTFWEHSFRADLKFEDVPVEKQQMEFLYADGDQCHFMNGETFEQQAVDRALVGPRAAFLEPGMSVPVEFIEGRPVNVLFPDVLEVRIVETAPAAHQQQDSTLKLAKLSNGIEIMVPQFIKAGETIRLDVENLKYMERASSRK